MPVKVVCLLPARNAAPDLPGFFESVAKFADLVVALDDGSSDQTFDMLSSQSLVRRVLRNPPRASYDGWDDAANRNALLAAAAEFSPDWIISIDADERLSADDGAALRAFLDQDALPGVAYGFRCYSMTGDLSHALPNPIWVYRLFAFEPGQRFPSQALHFAPIPTRIPRRAYLRTTFRIQHLGGMTPERKRARYEKYRQADPECRFWPDYSSLLREPDPADVLPWAVRPPEVSPFYVGEESLTRSTPDASEIASLSIVVVDSGSVVETRRSIAALVGAPDIVVTLVTDRPETFADFDGVHTVTAGPDRSWAARKNLGFRASTAPFVAFIDSSMIVKEGAVGVLLGAHRSGYALATGAFDLAGLDEYSRALAEAQFGEASRGESEGIVDSVPGWVSYRRSLLEEFGGFDESLSAGEERVLNRRLAERGYLCFHVGSVIASAVPSGGFGWGALAAGAFALGRADAGFLLSEHRDAGGALDRRQLRRLLSGLVPSSLPVDVPRQLTRSAIAAGTLTGMVRPSLAEIATLVGRPAGVALIVVRRVAQTPFVALVRFSLPGRSLKVLRLPADLHIPAVDGSWLRLSDTIARESAGGLSRFAAHDLVGRPFDLEIDDLLVVSPWDLPEGLRRWCERWVLRDGERVDLPWSVLLELLLAHRQARGVTSSLSSTALALILAGMKGLSGHSVQVTELTLAREQLDADAVEMVRAFLDVESIYRPLTAHNRLRLVEWA